MDSQSLIQHFPNDTKINELSRIIFQTCTVDITWTPLGTDKSARLCKVFFHRGCVQLKWLIWMLEHSNLTEVLTAFEVVPPNVCFSCNASVNWVRQSFQVVTFIAEPHYESTLRNVRTFFRSFFESRKSNPIQALIFETISAVIYFLFWTF